MDNKEIFKLDRRIVRYAVLAVALLIVIIYPKQIFLFIGEVYQLLFPLLLGLIFAYVLNIIIVRLERIYFPKTKNRFILKTKRGTCIFFSIALIVAVIWVIISIVLPQIVNAVAALAKNVPDYLNSLYLYLERNDRFPEIAEAVKILQLDWENIIKTAVSFITRGIGDILTTTFTALSDIIGAIFTFFIAFSFAIYALASKGALIGQLKKLVSAFVPAEKRLKIRRVLKIADESFSSFIVGQVTEAVILGILCICGMIIFRFPYATTVGTFIGATALIPIFGAWFGAGVGFLLILTVSPVKAVLFIVFIVILQQLENNLIYPRVVGTSVGLPGIWVLAAITVGGGLGGIGGMLISVPIMATVYRLVKATVEKRTAAKAAVSEKGTNTPGEHEI